MYRIFFPMHCSAKLSRFSCFFIQLSGFFCRFFFAVDVIVVLLFRFCCCVVLSGGGVSCDDGDEHRAT